MTSALEECYPPPPDRDQEFSDPVSSTPAAKDLDLERHPVGQGSALTWADLDEGQARAVSFDFQAWFLSEGREYLKAAGFSVAGREGNEYAADGATKCYEQWPDPRKRELFKSSPGYVYQLVRNLFVDNWKSGYSRHEKPCGLPGQPSDEAGSAELVWDRSIADEDPGWEVGIAVSRLEPAKGELIFLMFWLRWSREKARKHMGLTRYQVDQMYLSAIQELRVQLE